MKAAFAPLAALFIALTLSACGREEAEPIPVEETVFGDTVSAMDKARAVEDVTRQHKQDLDRAMEAAEGVH